MDEFYPMNPEQHNSFCHYVRKFYLEGFGLDPKRALLMDTWTMGVPPGMNAGELFRDGVLSCTVRLSVGVCRFPPTVVQLTARILNL